MNDSNSLNFTFLQNLLLRLSNQRLAFKVITILLVMALLSLAVLSKLNALMLLITTAPLLLLALLDASLLAQEQRCIARLVKFAENGSGDKLKAADWVWPLAPEATEMRIQRMVLALLSLSVWPFYLALGGIVAAGASTLTSGAKNPVVAAAAAHPGCGSSCSSGGGCGGGKGCGSGGGCGGSCGGSSTTSAPSTTQRNVNGMTSAQPRPGFFPVTPAQGNRPISNAQQPNITVMPQPVRPAAPATAPAPAVPSVQTLTLPPTSATPPKPASDPTTPPAAATKP